MVPTVQMIQKKSERCWRLPPASSLSRNQATPSRNSTEIRKCRLGLSSLPGKDLEALIKSAASTASLEFAVERPVPCSPLAEVSSWCSPANLREAALAADLITASRSLPGKLLSPNLHFLNSEDAGWGSALPRRDLKAVMKSFASTGSLGFAGECPSTVVDLEAVIRSSASAASLGFAGNWGSG